MEPQSRRSAGVPLVQCYDPYEAPVHVSAGGTNYTTNLATLTRFEESKLAKLFNGTLPIPLDPVNHHYFLNIDGNMFSHVLNFLRYEELFLPDNFDQMPLLLKIAQQLEIEPLVLLLQTFSKNIEKQQSDSSDTEDQICSKKKPQHRKLKRASKEKDDVDLLGNTEQRPEEGEREDNLITKLSENLESLIDDREGKLKNIIKENIDDRQKAEDKRMETLIKSVGESLDTFIKDLAESFQRLIVSSENRIQSVINGSDERKQSVDKNEDLVKRLGTSFEKVIMDSARDLEICFNSFLINNKNIMENIFKTRDTSTSVGVVVVRFSYQYHDRVWSYRSNCYVANFNIDIFCHGLAPHLVQPDDVRRSTVSAGSVRPSYAWTYNDKSDEDTLLRASYLANITYQLKQQDYHLITVHECRDDRQDYYSKFREYMYIRS